MDQNDPIDPILQRLRTQLSSLPALLEGVPPESFQTRVGGRWSVAENVAHLARHTELTLDRVARILSESEPAFLPYRAEQDPEWPGWVSRTLPDSLARLQASRAELIAAVERLSPSDLARVGRHARLGPLSLAAWLEFYLVHEGHHLYLIFKRSRGLE